MEIIVVSGGTKGIGEAIAKAFLENGYKVLTCSRNEENFNKARARMGECSKNYYFFKADLSKKEEAEAFADWVLKEHATPIGLINNSGIFIPGAVHEEEDGTLEKLMNANLYSAYWLSRKLIPEMIHEGKGHIFNICSTASIIPYENGGSYGISKTALLAFSKLLRVELMQKGIKVTSVLPGATWTDSWSESGIDRSRFIEVSDIAEMVLSTFKLSLSANVEEILIRPQLGDV